MNKDGILSEDQFRDEADAIDEDKVTITPSDPEETMDEAITEEPVLEVADEEEAHEVAVTSPEEDEAPAEAGDEAFPEETPTEDGDEAFPEETPTEDGDEALPEGETTLPPTNAEENPEAQSEEESELPAAEAERTAIPYYKNFYLRYGSDERQLDLKGTSDFLQALGFDGGELRQAREGQGTFEEYKEPENGANQMYCSYCGLEISGVEYQRLPDGRLRCTSCSDTLVKSEMQEMCDRVKVNMEAFFGADLNVPIHIEVLEERRLKKKIKSPLSVIDNKSILILGAAVNDKKGKGYKVYLENGAPRISVIATLAHELTHIWQYINWDNKKDFKVCPKDKRLLIYEGMAKWVEIQYLYLVGETAVARREEFITRNRNDAYGRGFIMVEDKYPLTHGTIVCDDAPFTKDGYPIE